MAIISTRVHGLLDYAGGLGSLAAPKVLSDRRASAMLAVAGAGTLTAAALTDYELGIRRRLPMPLHLLIDAGTGALLIAGARGLRRGGAGVGAWAPLVAVGVAEIAGAALTEPRPGHARTGGVTGPGVPSAPPTAVTGVSGTGAAARTAADGGPGLASAPPEAPGPSVNPLGSEASDVERTEHVDALTDDPSTVPDGDALVARQEAAAAAEAARIGGRVEPETGDPAMEPVYQAGGGEQDGWEAAEEQLIENATHGEGRAHPEQDAFTPELESDRAGAVYGEADEIPASEVVEDPSTGSWDPGEGPGLGSERGSGGQPRQEP